LDKVTIIIPVHNIIKRGFKRVLNSVQSLELQQSYLDEIIVVDSSELRQFEMLNDLLKLTKAKHYHLPLDNFNKPKLLNYGINKAESKFIMCTDSDYIFRKDFLKECERVRGEKVIIFKEVKMLPPISNINLSRIKTWNFPKSKFNQWKKLANGACQYATKKFFTENPYFEEMEGFGAMDNLTAYVAYNKGLKIHWLTQSEILHQYHQIENKMGGTNKKKFNKNQQVLEKYRKKYNLPKLLK
jgi:glycosyltransferase involved in cell wall biosynthesis